VTPITLRNDWVDLVTKYALVSWYPIRDPRSASAIRAIRDREIRNPESGEPAIRIRGSAGFVRV